jgi:putative transcriptional regulator
MKGEELEQHEAVRDVWQEVLNSVNEINAGGGKRFTPEPKTPAARSRLMSGLTQGEFAEILGVSKRTIEQWGQGRREPSGAARTLIRIAERHPEVLKEMVSQESGEPAGE